MKIVLLGITLLILIFFHGISSGADTLDGYAWEKMSASNDPTVKVMRESFISGYLTGYNSGHYYGTMNGSVNMKDYIFNELVPKTIAKESQSCANILMSQKESIESLPWLQGAASLMKKRFQEGLSAGYYVREIDSFYKTFPLCRKRSLSDMLFVLSQVWDDMPGNFTYKSVGETCLTNK